MGTNGKLSKWRSRVVNDESLTLQLSYWSFVKFLLSNNEDRSRVLMELFKVHFGGTPPSHAISVGLFDRKIKFIGGPVE